MTGSPFFLGRLKAEDIDEKLKLNAEDGRDVYFMENAIADELKEFELMVIRKKGLVCELGFEIEKKLRGKVGAPQLIEKEIERLNIERDQFEWEIIQNQIQIQSYREQLAHIRKKIADLEAVTNGV